MPVFLVRILYFAGFFGFFEKFIYRHGRGYWTGTLITILFFLSGSALAFALFSTEPLVLIATMSIGEIIAILVLSGVLLLLTFRFRYFTYDGPETESVGRRESFAFVLAKTADIFFQDVLAVMIILSLQEIISDPILVILLFTAVFFLSHLSLLFFVPFRLGVAFALASLLAGISFSVIVIYELGIGYIFVLHWIFYILAFRYLRDIRMGVYRQEM